MKNLIFFIYKYYVFFMFLAFEVFALIVLFRFNNYQQASFLNYTASTSSSIYNAINSTTGYFNLKTLNDSLQAENSRLRSQLLQSYYQHGYTTTTVNDTQYKQQYVYISAQVVNNSISKKNNFITIDKGSLHGVKRFDGVICPNGVVGIVWQVTPYYSLIQSVLNSKSNTGAKIKKTGDIGTVTWDGSNALFAQLSNVNTYVPVAIGDEVVSTTQSASYPEEIPIGKIVNIDRNPEKNAYDITILVHTPFSRLKNVYVVRNLFKESQQSAEVKVLEEEAKDHDN
jgi:rod shape-determining protein MreC